MANLECEQDNVLDWSNFTKDQITKNFVISITDEIMGYIVLPTIVSLGLLANVSYLLTFARTRWMHSTLYYYLLHLAVIDSTVLTVAYAQRLVTHLITPFNFTTDAFGEIGCIVGLVIEMLYYASLITVTTISVERYFAICHPLRHMKESSNKKTVKIFILTWVFGFTVAVLQLPQRFTNRVYCIIYPDIATFDEYPTTVRICVPIVAWYKTIYRLLQLTVFYSCLAINIYCYGKIVRSLSKRAVVGTTGSATGNKVKESQTAATRMILINGTVYFLCNSPVQVFLTLSIFLNIIGFPLQISPNIRVPFFTTLQVLVYINSAINPIIYSATNRHFRSAVWQTFGCSIQKANRKRATSQNTVSTIANDNV